MEKIILSARINPNLHQRLKKEVGEGKVSRFIEEAVQKKLDEQKKQILKEKKAFQEKLIAGYKAVAKNQKIQKEVEIWDETLNDAWKKDE